jgi:glycosyltransferase involved in cell wall biosynthesis
MDRKKIMFVIHGVGYGGAGKMIVFVVNAMAKLGFEVLLYSYDNLKCNYNLNDKVTLITTEINVKNKFKRAIIAVRKILERINNYNPDVVVSFLSDANTYSFIASKLSRNKPPVIICERGDPYNDNASFSKTMQNIFKHAQGAVFQSKGAQQYFGHGLVKRSTIIPNPAIDTKIDIEPFRMRYNEIVFPARFTNIQKRHDIMVNAFKIVHNKYPNMKLVFIGDGPDQDKIKHMVFNEGLNGSVEFLGSISNVINRIKESKIFAITSDYEGIPNSLIEAMSIGMPVVSTDMSPGGARLLIENKKNGFLVPVRDYKAIADAIIFYIENPEVADEIGLSAKEIIKEYSDDKIINMWKEYINQIINEN